MKEIRGKSILVRVSTRFKLARVRGIGGRCEVRVGEGSSYRGSIVPASISRKRFYLNGELRVYFSVMDRGLKGQFMPLLS